MNAKLVISTIAAAAALCVNAYAADVVTSSGSDTITKSYGRAGGLVGADRVSGLQAGTARESGGYDADVAERTNMPRAQVGSQTVVEHLELIEVEQLLSSVQAQLEVFFDRPSFT